VVAVTTRASLVHSPTHSLTHSLTLRVLAPVRWTLSPMAIHVGRSRCCSTAVDLPVVRTVGRTDRQTHAHTHTSVPAVCCVSSSSSDNILLTTSTILEIQSSDNYWQYGMSMGLQRQPQQFITHFFLFLSTVPSKCVRCWERRPACQAVRGLLQPVGVRRRCRLLSLGSAPFCVSDDSCASLETQLLSGGYNGQRTTELRHLRALTSLHN
jgi:hypothetical protein